MAMKKKPKTTPQNHVVTIYVDGSGTFTYSDDQHSVRPKDTLQWTCNRDFAVIFMDGKTVFKDKTWFLSAKANDYTMANLEIKNPVFKKKYKYSVIANIGGNDPVRLDDPHIIIDDSGGGGDGGGKKPARKPAKKKSKAAKK